MPSCDWTSISQTAATAPRLPSIWKTVSGFVPPGGERSSRLDSVLWRRTPNSCSCAAAPSWKRAQSSDEPGDAPAAVDRLGGLVDPELERPPCRRCELGRAPRRDLSVGIDREEMRDMAVARLPLDVVLAPLLQLARVADAHRRQAWVAAPQLGAKVLVDTEELGGLGRSGRRARDDLGVPGGAHAEARANAVHVEVLGLGRERGPEQQLARSRDPRPGSRARSAPPPSSPGTALAEERLVEIEGVALPEVVNEPGRARGPQPAEDVVERRGVRPEVGVVVGDEATAAVVERVRSPHR